MSPHFAPHPETPPAQPPKTAAERIRDLSHVAALVADELEALEQEDFARMRELHGMRERLLEEDGSPLEERIAELAAAVERIAGWLESEEHSRSRLSELRDGSLPLVRGMQRPHGTGSYAPLGPLDAKVDVRL